MFGPQHQCYDCGFELSNFLAPLGEFDTKKKKKFREELTQIVDESYTYTNQINKNNWFRVHLYYHERENERLRRRGLKIEIILFSTLDTLS